MKKLKQLFATKKGLSAVAVGAMASSFSLQTFATGTAITDAYTAGNANVTLAVLGLIGLMALLVGIGAIIAIFKRG